MIRTPFQDLAGGIRRWQLGLALSWNDTVMPLRSSYLGLVWASLQIGLLVLVLYLLFRDLRGQDVVDYAIYVSAGVTVYQFISIGLVDGSTTFSKQAGLIKNVPHPISLYVFRLFYKQIILACFAAPIILIAIVYTNQWPNLMELIVACAGVVLVSAAFTGLALAVGTACVVVHDLSLAIAAMTRLLFFMTPVFWVAETRGGFRGLLSTYNPFTYFLNVVREPLRGNMPTMLDYLVVAACLVGFWIVGVVLFSLIRPRISALV
ncbi:MAG: ABC-type lipopolysaccharide export system permease component RfbA [Oceanicaulis sp. HLUCCA04]|nr:MAG: ABC-type lipopolysaccharide export system permease component RfbA [Oceanicaulis sp. HLUCCA04]